MNNAQQVWNVPHELNLEADGQGGQAEDSQSDQDEQDTTNNA